MGAAPLEFLRYGSWGMVWVGEEDALYLILGLHDVLGEISLSFFTMATHSLWEIAKWKQDQRKTGKLLLWI